MHIDYYNNPLYNICYDFFYSALLLSIATLAKRIQADTRPYNRGSWWRSLQASNRKPASAREKLKWQKNIYIFKGHISSYVPNLSVWTLQVTANQGTGKVEEHFILKWKKGNVVIHDGFQTYWHERHVFREATLVPSWPGSLFLGTIELHVVQWDQTMAHYVEMTATWWLGISPRHSYRFQYLSNKGPSPAE